ncbi:hypothetical protein PY650_10155 [Rhizobium calliandrae]|uniref:Uncharacterized protein n=1 Tax=Rhizobium calliandrae TaxID=1312182 RepID=A0ABT7KBM7_9HYPH|nr:hypothetical protein [Rhizobium calliandrae]MDL2406021.1 hypothetical protein [Rhizobium calliandrae]
MGRFASLLAAGGLHPQRIARTGWVHLARLHLTQPEFFACGGQPARRPAALLR